MISLNATMLESFRLYLTGDWMSDADIMARLKREPSEPTPEMRTGTAFHDVVQGCGELVDGGSRIVHPIGVYLHNGRKFDAAGVEPVRMLLAGYEYEVSGEYQFGDTVIRCKADALSPAVAVEVKTTMKPSVDLGRYLESYQWRCYSLAFGVRAVMYVIVRLEERNGVHHVAGQDVVTAWEYDGMREDVERLAGELVAAAERWGVADYLVRE